MNQRIVDEMMRPSSVGVRDSSEYAKKVVRVLHWQYDQMEVNEPGF